MVTHKKVSGLSGNEIFCMSKLGATPGQLCVGNSVVAIGVGRGLGAGLSTLGGGEVAEITELVRSGRQNSFSRMMKEASQDSGSGITGITFDMVNHGGSLEFVTTGSTVHGNFANATQKPFSTSADAQQLYCQIDAGFQPLHFVFGNVAYSIGVSGNFFGAFRALRRGEVPQYSQIFDRTRHLALSRLINEAKNCGANAIIGIETSITPLMGTQEMMMVGTASHHPLLEQYRGEPVHGGPFANIAHGCNSILATRMALAHADYAVTEAGFAFDLGAEKFFDIKCRVGGLNPAAIVIVATVRALKMHGGTALNALTKPNPVAVERGLANLAAHLDAAAHFSKPTLVAINQFASDSVEELDIIHHYCSSRNVASSTANVFGAGGKGASELAAKVVEATSGSPTPLIPLYDLELPIEAKIERIAKAMYGAEGVTFLPAAQSKIKKARRLGYGSLPICMAKTQDSLSDKPKLRGRPQGFTITVRDLEIAAGAGFLVALTGELVRMPGLPERPAAERIDLNDEGEITGLS